MTKTSVLVVEDNPVISGMIRHFLKKSDYAIGGTAISGEEAVAMAGQLKPDLALMDVQLATAMDGIEAAGLIWNQFRIPVIYLTASSDEESISRAASTEAYGYLHKPIQERELSASIQIALKKYDADCRVKEKEKWLETTLRCITDAVIAADSVGCVKLINPTAEALTGWTQEEAVGQDLLDVFRVLECGTRLPAECAVVEVIRYGSGSTSKARQSRILISRDGSEAIVEESAAPIINDAGNIVGVVLVFRALST